MPEAETRTNVIKVYCTLSEKKRIQAQAESVKSRSVSEYILVTVLEGNSDRYGFKRRKADGPLINAATYQRLGEIVSLLSERVPNSKERQEMIELIQATRREIVLKRLLNSVELG